MSNRPTILTLADYYLPGYKAGGPIQTIANIVSQLGDQFRFKIITSDRDLGDSTSYPGVELNRWITLGKAEVFYVRSADPIRVLRIIQSTPHDVLYLNSCFARGFSIIPMMAASLRLLPDRPIILAPRGEFSLGAIQIKAGRKTAYLRIARWFSAYQKAIWHASSPFEAADILRAFCGVDRMGSRATALQRNRAQIVIAPDIACLLPIATDGVQVGKQCRRKEPGVLRTVFLSRVSRKKNLAEAIRLLDALQGHVEFDIYGPIEDISY
ncbi:MAG: hypothetical protein GXX84_20290 [Acidobacteria bacterium]|nr:hypothetical protein [Acidobacteriota bacterium]